MEKTEEGMLALEDYMKDPSDKKGSIVADLEEEADKTRAVLIHELQQAFVTPMDREDIFSLSKSIDDMIDYAKSTVEEMHLFKGKTNENLKKMTEALVSIAKEISEALKHLENKQDIACNHITRVKRTENYIEHIYREALADLFNEKDHRKIFKMREIYRHLSNAADRADAAADIMNNIIVKTT